MQTLASDRANCLATFLDEKKKSYELKKALDIKKIKSSEEFEIIFKDLQLVKGAFNW